MAASNTCNMPRELAATLLGMVGVVRDAARSAQTATAADGGPAYAFAVMACEAAIDQDEAMREAGITALVLPGTENETVAVPVVMSNAALVALMAQALRMVPHELYFRTIRHIEEMMA